MTALHSACEGLQRLDGATQDARAASTSGAAATGRRADAAEGSCSPHACTTSSTSTTRRTRRSPTIAPSPRTRPLPLRTSRQQQFAKTVMLKVDGKLAMMVMPAAYRVDLTRLSRALGGDMVELASEAEFKDAFPDCELGAMPPFGNLYGMPVYVDSRLAQQPEIAFNAGIAHRCGAHAVRGVREAGAAGTAVAGACDVKRVHERTPIRNRANRAIRRSHGEGAG